MIREGYGFEHTYRLPYRYQDRFKAAQRDAREAGQMALASSACGGVRGGGPAKHPRPYRSTSELSPSGRAGG